MAGAGGRGPVHSPSADGRARRNVPPPLAGGHPSCSPSPRGRGLGGGGWAEGPPAETKVRGLRMRSRLTGAARVLRRHSTDAERVLWRHLRNRQLKGKKFRRQAPIGPYVVDFVCHEARLVVEVDGGQHAQARDRDQARDAWLRSQGYRVLRFWNNEVLRNTQGVLERIAEELGGGEEELSTPSPPHPGPLRIRGQKSEDRGRSRY